MSDYYTPQAAFAHLIETGQAARVMGANAEPLAVVIHPGEIEQLRTQLAAKEAEIDGVRCLLIDAETREQMEESYRRDLETIAWRALGELKAEVERLKARLMEEFGITEQDIAETMPPGPQR